MWVGRACCRNGLGGRAMSRAGSCFLLSTLRGGALHRRHAPHFAVWPFSKSAPRRGRRSREAGCGTDASQIIYVARSPAPRRRSCPTAGGDGIRAAQPRSGPGPLGSSPSRATVARPIRRRRPPRHPVHDPGSREGGDVDYGGGFGVWIKKIKKAGDDRSATAGRL